jgi:glycosyltransferase involved in cell wall biosynthesis
MSLPRLTIAIPTYNRAHLLERRLQELIPQVQAHPGVALCVFDDASTDSTPEVIERYRSELTVMERGPVNLGIGGNMLRAFEAGGTGWLWTLGDDDPVAPEAVATALDLIRQMPDAFTINCDSEGGRNPRDYSVSSIPELLTEKEIADVLFMSSNLYNLAVLQPRMKVFCQSIGTLAPHLALVLSALEGSGKPLCFSTRQLTVYHYQEQRWSSLEAAMGIAQMPLYIREIETQRQVARSARAVTRWMLRYGLREVTNASDFERWKRYAWTVNRMLESHGAGFLNDLKASRDGDGWLLRIAPVLLSWMPYWMVKARANRLRRAHAGESVLLGNSVAVATRT